MDTQLFDLAEKALKFAASQKITYCDVRAEIQSKKSVVIENKEIDSVRQNFDEGIGVRILKNGAWGFFSISKPKSFVDVQEKILQTIKNAEHYSERKKEKTKLIPIKANKLRKDFPVSKTPELNELIEIGLECNKIIFQPTRIKKATVNSWEAKNSKYFISSEGADIIQNFTDVVIDMIAVAHESGVSQAVNITEGGRGGIEQITRKEKAQQSANNISKRADNLLDAKPVKEDHATVIMNPDFVALLTHEILGHPSEADRVLGKEMAWAGGAWWKDKLGQRIGSEHLSVFDDPTIEESLGWYFFDDEGIQAKKTTLVKNGVLENHMQNRETSAAFQTQPTGNMRATSYRFVPLIRMACTCIDPGDWKPEEMIKDVKNGYLISNMKIPSIDMKRYNWSISCQYAQKIENGEIKDLLRDVIVMGVAPDFFTSIDACGNDFEIRPITNCGKGDPMQSMIMGNGGPSIRGKATVKSVI